MRAASAEVRDAADRLSYAIEPSLRLTLLGALTTPDDAEETAVTTRTSTEFPVTFQVSGPLEVFIRNPAGTVEVTAGDDGEAVVDLTGDSDAVSLIERATVKLDGNTLRVEIPQSRGFVGPFQRVAVRAQLPRNSSVGVDVGSADVRFVGQYRLRQYPDRRSGGHGDAAGLPVGEWPCQLGPRGRRRSGRGREPAAGLRTVGQRFDHRQAGGVTDVPPGRRPGRAPPSRPAAADRARAGGSPAGPPGGGVVSTYADPGWCCRAAQRGIAP